MVSRTWPMGVAQKLTAQASALAGSLGAWLWLSVSLGHVHGHERVLSLRAQPLTIQS